MKTLSFNLLAILLFFSVSIFAQNSASTDAILSKIDEMPQFPGCEDLIGTPEEKKHCAEKKMLEYIYTSIIYPTEARKLGIQGMNVVSFVIEKDGSVTDPRMLLSLGSGCDEEVIRIVNAMPKWIPGKHEGELVRVQFNLPVRFMLEGKESPLPPGVSLPNDLKIEPPRKTAKKNN